MTIEEILKLRQEAGGLNKLMHMHVVTLDKDGGATVELDLTPELLNPLGMAHGGTMTAENLDSGGACFRFYLPLEEGINSEIEG